MRRRWWITVVAVISLLATGCGEAEPELRKELEAAIEKTQQQPHSFVLQLSTPERDVEVNGILEDDARYQAAVSLDGRPAWEEVVSDDALADRFLDASVLPLFLEPSGDGAKAALPDVRAELAAGRWVIDEVGAPDLLTARIAAADPGGGAEPRLLGTDPVLDAVTALDYVRRVLKEQEFRLFNENDLDYDPAEDTFPIPDDDSPLRRYDSVRTRLPTAAQIQGFGGRAQFPDTANFRRMSIYVHADGTVVRVMEKVDVASRLRELTENAGLSLPDDLPQDKAAAVIVESLNELREGQGDQPIDVHELDLQLSTDGDQEISFPTSGTKGSLDLLIGRGRPTQTDAADAA